MNRDAPETKLYALARLRSAILRLVFLRIDCCAVDVRRADTERQRVVEPVVSGVFERIGFTSTLANQECGSVSPLFEGRSAGGSPAAGFWDWIAGSNVAVRVQGCVRLDFFKCFLTVSFAEDRSWYSRKLSLHSGIAT